jgi:hypothetical protein
MTDLFDVRLWLYPGANPQDDPAFWEPYAVDISSSIRHPGSDGGQPITYSGGRQDEASQVDAGQMQLTLDNRTGTFSTDNVAGTYYGLLDLNTPIRMGVRSWVDNFTRTVSNDWGTVDAAQSFLWTVGSAPAFNVDGSKGTVTLAAANTATSALASRGTAKDVDVTCSVIPAATATGASYGLGVVVRRTDTSNNAYSTVEFDTAGTVTIKIRSVVAGSVTQLNAQNPIPASTYTAGVAWKLRTQADGNQIRAKAWPAASTEPTAWMVTGTIPAELTGNSVGIYAVRFAGNTNSGVVPFIGMDDYAITALEYTGFVVSWPNLWDMTGNNSWAAITAAGVLRRLRQGSNPVQSPLRRQLAATADVTGYWPMEDGASAKTLSSAVSSQQPATFFGVTPASDATLAGGGSAPTITSTGGSIGFTTHTANNGTGFSAMFFVKLSSLPASKTRLARFRTNRGPVPIWDLSIDATGLFTEGLDTDGSVLTSATNAFAVDFTQWVAWQLETDNTVGGGNTGWSSITHQVGATSYWAQTGTVAGTLTSWIYSGSLTGPTGTAFAHAWFGKNTLPFVDNTFSLVSSGYAGELAGDRFDRVCGEAGIPALVRVGTSETMGPQREGTTIAILQSCVDADYAVLAERGAGLEFIPRSLRWNVAARMSVSKAAGEVGQVPSPVRDDQRFKNRWTVGRVNGGSGVFQDDASVARNGTWEDSATLNVFDDSVLVNHAAWRVNVGTVRRMRLSALSLNLARNRLLVPFWRARDYGFRILVTLGVAQMTGAEPDLIVEGWIGTLWPNGWTLDLNCTPALVWRSGVADDTGIYGRVDSDACTTTGSITSTTVAIPITTTSGQLKWDNTAGLWTGGVDFNVGGERITVTSITNGAGQTQTLNATVRGVNGYASSHASGVSVSLWDPAVVGL